MILLDTDLWHDPLFQFGVSAALAALAILVSVWIYRKQRSKKELTYQVLSDAPVISVNQNLTNRVEIRFDGNLVKEVSLAVIKIWNSGNVAVRKDDYEEPIRFKFNGRKVISSEVLATEPKDLIDAGTRKTFLKQGSDHIELPPILLNPKQKESITFSVLLDGEGGGAIEKRARIIDGDVIEIRDNKTNDNWPTIAIAFLVAAIAIDTGVIYGIGVGIVVAIINIFVIYIINIAISGLSHIIRGRNSK